MSILRCGDVVTREGDSQELRVTGEGAGSDGTRCWDVVWVNSTSAPIVPSSLRLLRRTLQPGDILRHVDASNFLVKVTEVGDDAVFARDTDTEGYELSAPFDLILEKWCHVDGTPIEHPSMYVPEDEPSVTVNLGGFGCPSVEELARAFFRTDPDVLRIVRRAADAVRVLNRETVTSLLYDGPNMTVTYSVEEEDEERLERALDVAWRIDESSRRSYWTERARAAIARMNGGGK